MFRESLFTFMFFVCFGRGMSDECPPPERRSAEDVLRDKLFCNYKKDVRPVNYFANQTLVQIELFPLKISMDVFAERITIHGNIEYVWTDMYLQWDPEEFEDIKMLPVSSDEIWLPEIAIDAPSENQDSRFSMSDCLVSHAGKVVCIPVDTINAFCSPDLLNYPYDKHNCSLIFLATSYTGTHLDLNILDSGVQMSFYRPNKVWHIVSISLKQEITHATNSTFYPYLKCNIIIQRHSAGHQAIVILPGLVLGGLTLLTFCMGDLYISRIFVAGLTLLSNIEFGIYLGYEISSNGDQVPLVITFFRNSVVISGIAIMIANLVHHLQTLSSPAQNWLSSSIGKLETSPVGKVFFIRNFDAKDEDTTEIITDSKGKVTIWSRLATIIDRVAFFTCLLVYVILFFFYLPSQQ